MPVNSERKDYDAMKPKWTRLRDCSEGRDALLRAGNKYVPDLDGASVAANTAYRARGNFYNAVSRTVAGLAGAIFQKAPEVNFPEGLKNYLDDITLTGVSFEMFAGDAGREVMLTGRFGVLIDMPAEESPENRPYCVGFAAEDIINWRTERLAGDEELTMLVLHETAESTDEKDPFVITLVNQYRVIEMKNSICTVTIWQEKGSGSKEFIQVGDPVTLTRRGTALDFIPFVFLGAIHSTPEIERPPLLDLADVNLGHWRNSVDFEYGLHLVALPTPWIAGGKGPKEGAMRIGPAVVWELEASGSAGMLEFSGAGLGAISTAMEAKVKSMATLGARLFEEPVRGDTATAVLIRHAGEHASLRTVAGSMEEGFSSVLQIVGWWSGTEAQPGDVDANVELNKEYLDIKATAQEVQVALTALQAGAISFDTFWDIISTGGWGREGVDANAELKAINERKALAPEPALDPALSPSDIVPPAPPKKKTIAGADGTVKYTITEA